MIKQIFQLRREYEDAKGKAIEQTVNHLEAKTDFLFFILFFSLTVVGWIYAIFAVEGFEEMYEKYEFYPIILFFVFSYFFLFLGSKFIFKPSHEELSDDTSIFALFSACKRKEMRSLISIGISILHSLIFIFCMINKDVGFIRSL